MELKVEKVVVIGAGLMGSRIAGHLANVGIPSYLLDILPPELTEKEKAKGLTMEDSRVRNRLAREGIEKLIKSVPGALYTRNAAELITPGNIEDHLEVVAEADWVIEAIIENLEIKEQLMDRMEEHLKQGTIISSNTSGISIAEIASQLSEEHRQSFLGTHFFNPPRYMKLLEIIPTEETSDQVLSFMCDFGREVLGKEVVVTRDTPNFIANRIGGLCLASTVSTMFEKSLSIEEVDALTGRPMGRPSSASFLTMDMVGLDTFLHVARNIIEQTDDELERELYEMPDFVKEMEERGWLGQKSGKGFYEKIKDEEGKSQILTLDYEELDYRPQEKARLSLLDKINNISGFGDKLRAMTEDDSRAGSFVWQHLKHVLLFTADKLPAIADSVLDIDACMRYGYNWKKGPFEVWDALGVEESVARMRDEGESIPRVVEEMLSLGEGSFYLEREGTRYYYDYQEQEYKELPVDPRVIDLPRLKKEERVVLSNPGASLIELEDGVVCLEFTSPNNSVGEDVIRMVNDSLEEVEQNYRGMVIGNQGRHFCVGANLMLLLMEAQSDNFFGIELMVKEFQQMNMRMKYFSKPIVAAPFSMTVGGGCEICMHAHRVNAAAETYIGLVELGVGLIPAAGGTKEVVLRSIEGVESVEDMNLQPLVNEVFETVAMGKVAKSAREGQELGFLRPDDKITLNDRFLIDGARRMVVAMDQEGFEPPVKKKVPVLGEDGYAVLKLGVYNMREGNYISEYDQHLAESLARIMTGGRVKAGTRVTEEHLLELEREVFMSLIGEPKTQERMEHMLKHRKPLRN